MGVRRIRTRVIRIRVAIGVLGVVLLVGWAIASRWKTIPDGSQHPGIFGLKSEGNICLIHGTMRDKSPSGSESSRKRRPIGTWGEGLGSTPRGVYMIRLRFAVQTPEECQTVVETYCRERGSEGFEPKELEANFRRAGAKDPEVFWDVGSQCAVRLKSEASLESGGQPSAM